MNIAIGSDHAGVVLKDLIISLLADLKVSHEDLGTNGSDPVDYPDYGAKVAEAVSQGRADRGQGGVRRPDHRVRRDGREVAHDHEDHRRVTSLERRYIIAASSGRPIRSYTMPRPYSARECPGCNSAARW